MKYTKDQKRRWKIEKRLKCHGTKDSCEKFHPGKREKTEQKIEKKEKKISIWQKILIWLKKL